MQIDSVSAGAEVGSANFRWKRSDGTWQASGLATSSSLTSLENGISVKWTSGTGDDFNLNDAWSFIARRNHGAEKLADRDPNSYWKSTGIIDESITMDLGSAQQVTAFCLGEHNLSSTATITLMANSADSWASPAWSQGITRTAKHLGIFLDQTYRYWRIRLQDAANADGYLRAAEVYLGGYFEPVRNYATGGSRAVNYNRTDKQADGNYTGSSFSGRSESMSLVYGHVNAADLAAFREMFDATNDLANRKAIPLWFWPDSSDASDILFGQLGESPGYKPTDRSARYQRLSFNFDELPRSAA